VKSFPLCGALLPDGRLLIVSSADGVLLRREPDGSSQRDQVGRLHADQRWSRSGRGWSVTTGGVPGEGLEPGRMLLRHPRSEGRIPPELRF
jgi:hypothetical protein